MKKLLVALMLVSLFAVPALAVDLTANDAMGTTSFNSAGKWSDALAPSAGKTYDTKGFLLRSPTTAGSYTFAGDSLTVGRGAVPAGTAGYGDPFLTTGGVNNNALIAKASNLILTVDNLILDAGTIRDGLGTNDVWTFAGNITIAANGGGFANQCRLNLNSVLKGSGTIYIADNGSGEANRATWINSSQNTYNGSIQLNSTHTTNPANYSRINFADDSRMNFVIGLSGVSNKISGTGTATFAGDFNFDLTGASANLGDSWMLVSTTAKTFSDTFTVVGFTDMGSNYWMKAIDQTLNYKFEESTGILSVVPEPASMLLLGLGSLALLRKKR